ncbi:chloroplastic group IIA intron splicing facilitator CRS1, chloroplastic [Phalaenopsis equestris]|uniref:chloroplastic group IIA intron splicing facilitator CRS1, chloroplastic n=1 Tax=Phalaenopsis equestris TaxID=78828 RepID=UPI0009E36D51|nr:chloroplastic group IIA intron splicing facilitator CRS1, chloroplastic [Phalaenopsis equestris]
MPLPAIFSSAAAGVRMPTAPWMTSPLILPADQILDLSKPRKKNPSADEGNASHHFLTSGIRGGRSREAMRKILKSVSLLRKTLPPLPEPDDLGQEASADFTLPLNVLDAISASEAGDDRSRKYPWATGNEERLAIRRLRKKRIQPAAEMVLPAVELERLRGEAMKMRKWVRGKKAGVTPEVVKGIRRAWRKKELAMVKIVDPLRQNMVRAHEIVEAKTGGLVVWRKKDVIVLYKGEDYQRCTKALPTLNPYVELSSSKFDSSNGSIDASLYERESNRLLDGLGPRFIDWWRPKPLPVDADLLPEIVRGFKTPFRLCPPYEWKRLSDDDLTYLRKLARPLPTHFALSKNTKLQGLACAIMKLWERSLIAKIAIKVGIQNTNSQQMAWELKRLTGGVLILRNKFYIILYRGKDFLPTSVADSVLEREAHVQAQHLSEEKACSKAAELFHESIRLERKTSSLGTYREFQHIRANYSSVNNVVCKGELKIAAEIENLKKTLREHERGLFILKVKLGKSEKVLRKLSSSWSPSELSADRELLTEEERESLRKIGMKMDKILLLGRRGIYDGVIASIHQHWKHREVVKVITMQKITEQITHTAKLLEIESGGIVVALEKQGIRHAIILYRGRNYRRPLELKPEHLLTKREALQRSVELQRRGSLKFFAKEREQYIQELKRKLRELEQRAGG